MTLRQYWKDASFRPCLVRPPAPREAKEAVREPLPPVGVSREAGRELVRDV